MKVKLQNSWPFFQQLHTYKCQRGVKKTGPDWDSNPGPLAYRARNPPTETLSHPCDLRQFPPPLGKGQMLHTGRSRPLGFGEPLSPSLTVTYSGLGFTTFLKRSKTAIYVENVMKTYYIRLYMEIYVAQLRSSWNVHFKRGISIYVAYMYT